MFFRPTPLFEASVTYAATGLVSILSFFNVSETMGLATLEGMFLMLPAFFLWSVVGLALRNFSYVIRFIGAAAIILVVAVLAYALFMQAYDQLQNAADRSSYLDLRVIPALSTFVVSGLLGAGFCQFWLVRRH
jgi:uncharacterized membrane protein